MSCERYPAMQCLLFAVHESSSSVSEPSSFRKKEGKAFVLLPSSIVKSNPTVCQIFIQNNVQPLSNEVNSALQLALTQNHVEIIEFFLLNGGKESRAKARAPTRLQVAIDKSNESIVKKIFGRNVVFCKSECHPGKMLHVADKRNESIIKNILSVRADVKLSDPKESTLLHLAVIRCQETLIKLLLAHDADINAERTDGSTPLHLAAQNGNPRIVKLLLKSGACINAREKNGATSLYLAIEGGHLQVYQLLVRSGASISIGKFDGSTVLHAAAKNGHVEIFKDLLQREVDIDTPIMCGYLKGFTPLFAAVEKGHTVIAKRLLDLGANVNAESSKGSVLCVAANKKRVETVKCILKYSPNIDCKSSRKALGKLICEDGEDSQQIFHLLSQYGFTVCAEDASNLELLHRAVRKNYYDVVKTLLKHGAKVNEVYVDRKSYCFKFQGVKRYDQYLPLHTAVRFADGRMMQLLLDHGADVNLQSCCSVFRDDYETPLKVAVHNRNLEAVKVLLTNGALVNYCHILNFLGHRIAEVNYVKIMELLLNAANLTVEETASVFVRSVIYHNLGVFKFLLKRGVSVDLRGVCEGGRTALHAAAAWDLGDIVQLLIVHNASIEIEDDSGETPLFIAVKYGCHSVIDVLLKFGASVDVSDKYGRSALQYTVALGKMDIFEASLNALFRDPQFIISTSVWPIFNLSCLNEDAYMYNKYQNNKQRFTECSHIFERCLVKVEAANLGLRDENITLSWPLSGVDNFRHDCGAEIARLKTLNVGNTDLTFYDILVSDTDNLTGYVRNKTVHQMLESGSYKKQFPIYASVIKSQVQKGIQRRELLDEGLKICRHLFSKFLLLPLELREKILSYLTNQNLAVLKYAVTGSVQ